MISDEVCSNSRNKSARRGGSSATAVALALILAACGSEAENADTKAAQSGTEQKQAMNDTAEAAAESAPASASASEETTMADAGEAAGSETQTASTDSGSGSDGGTQKTAAKEEKKEQEREPMDGYTVYNRFCRVCHAQGMNGAPKFRNKNAWAPRIEKGKETLYKHSLEGFKAMPPKGGIAGLYDQEVKDAVDYMVKNAGGWDSGG